MECGAAPPPGLVRCSALAWHFQLWPELNALTWSQSMVYVRYEVAFVNVNAGEMFTPLGILRAQRR
jgi:hypothetical protein